MPHAAKPSAADHLAAGAVHLSAARLPASSSQLAATLQPAVDRTEPRAEVATTPHRHSSWRARFASGCTAIAPAANIGTTPGDQEATHGRAASTNA